MPTRTLRSGILALLATAGLLAGTSQAVAAQPGPGTKTTSSRAAASAAYAKVYLTTVIDQWTHYTPDAQTSSHAGTLYAGRSYFYCFTEGAWYAGDRHSSPIWLLTDDDTGHRNVWVSDVNLDGWGWAYDTDVLPHC